MYLFLVAIQEYLNLCFKFLLKQREKPSGKCSHTNLESINENLVESALRIVNREEKGKLFKF